MLGTNYRLYTFMNFYLSSIQMGIQSAHIVSEMFTMYPQGKTHNVSIYGLANANAHFVLNKWAADDKTIIVLNGGTSFDIRQDYLNMSTLCEAMNGTVNFSSRPQHSSYALPHVAFYEDHNALGEVGNGLMTGFGVVVPEQLWNAKEQPPRQVGWAADYDHARPHLEYQFSRIGENNKIVENVNFWSGTAEAKFISILKSKSLAR